MQDFDRVVQFHQKFGIDYSGPLRLLPEDLAWRRKFLDEELGEYAAADFDRILHEMFDGLVDFVYVALGTIHLHGGKAEARLPVNKLGNPPRHLSLEENSVFVKSVESLLAAYDAAPTPEVKIQCLELMITRVRDAADLHGFPWEKGFAAVHKANMTKRLSLPGEGRGTNDIIKPAGWTAPDLG